MKRSLLVFCTFLALLYGSKASATVYGIGTQINTTVDIGQTIIYAETDTVMAPNPHNPSSSASYIYQSRFIPVSPTGDGIYFAFSSTTVTLHGRGYQVEIVTRDNGVLSDPYISCTAFPGDGVSWYFYGSASPPYVKIAVNNASHVSSGPCNAVRNYTPAHALTKYLQPEVAYKVSTGFDSHGAHNCNTDMPASNFANHVSEQWFFNYVVGADYSEYFPVFIPPTYQNPGLTPAGCDLETSTGDDASGDFSSFVDSYGW